MQATREYPGNNATESGAKKHPKKLCIKNFLRPPRPPPRNSLCRPFSCILKGKETPNIKNLRGQGSPEKVWEGGGSGRGGGSAQILYVYALFLVPDRRPSHVGEVQV